VAEDALKKMPANLAEVVDAAIAALDAVEDFTAENTEAALREALIDGLGLKPRLAFGPVRSAVAGRRISPPLFESLEILGKDSALARLRAFRAQHA
jgi:glutamyl-tRNA synthetase